MPVQAHKFVFPTLVCFYQEQTSVRTNVIDAYTCILLPGILENSKQVFCWPRTLEVRGSPYIFYKDVRVLISFMMFYDVKPQLVKSCCRGSPKQNITKSHMPIFITNTKLQYKPKSFHYTLPLNLIPESLVSPDSSAWHSRASLPKVTRFPA